MFCKNCGRALPDNSQFCSYCGADLRSTANNNYNNGNNNFNNNYNNFAPNNFVPPYVYEPAKGLAIASMVLGIVSFFCFGLITGIIAIVLGAVAKNKGNRTPKATAGIVCGVIAVGFYILWMILIFTGVIGLSMYWSL